MYYLYILFLLLQKTSRGVVLELVDQIVNYLGHIPGRSSVKKILLLQLKLCKAPLNAVSQ